MPKPEIFNRIQTPNSLTIQLTAKNNNKMSTKSNASIIEDIPVNDLLVIPGLQARTDKNAAANLKRLTETIGDRPIDGTIHCVQYIERDGKKFVIAGHTLHAFAKKRGDKTVPAGKTSYSEDEIEANQYLSNTGASLTPYELGGRMVRLRDGIPLFEPQKGDAVPAPKTVKEIAALYGLTAARVDQCILIRESSPEIQTLIELGIVANAVVIKAAGLASKREGKEKGKLDAAKQLKIIKAAINHAKEESRDIATAKDFDAVKAQFDFVPKSKKLRAATAAGTPAPSPAPNAPQSSETPSSNQHASVPANPSVNRTGEAVIEDDNEPESDQSNEQKSDGELNLETHQPIKNPVIKPVDQKGLDAHILAAINSADEEFSCDLEDNQITGIVKAVSLAVQTFLSPI